MAFQRRVLTPEEMGMTSGGRVVPVPHLGRWGVIDTTTGMPIGHYASREAAELANRAYNESGLMPKGEGEYKKHYDFVSVSKRPVDVVVVDDDFDGNDYYKVETIPGRM